MIPVRLVLQGIYSYKERQTIEFTPLINAHLFGIFGGVGSGKSTILEAISYALYGKTERLSKHDDQKYNMMNLSSSDLFIEFVFRAGAMHEDEYKFTVTGKRNSRRFEDVKKFDRQAYRKESEGWLPLEIDNAETILGISYDNFKRTIIIPQGMFQEFIQLEPSKRTVMMMDLFNLHKYDLSGKVSVLESRNMSHIDQLKGRISQISDATAPEQIQSMEEQVLLISGQLIENTKEQNSLTDANNLQNTLQSLATQFQEVNKKLVEIESQKDYFAKKEEKIKQYDLCIQHFKDILTQYNEQKKSVSNNTEILDQLKKDEISCNKDHETLKATLSEIEVSYKLRDQNREKMEDLSRIIEIKELELTLNSGNTELEKLKKKLSDMEKVFADTKDKLEPAEKKIRELKKNQPDITILSQIQQWFTEKKHLQEKLKTLNDEIIKNEKNKKDLENQKELILSSQEIARIISKDDRKLKISEITVILEKKTNELKNMIKGLEERLAELIGSEQLVEYVRQVKNGKPCPLCGAVDHPSVLKIEDVSDAKKQIVLEKQKALETMDLIADCVSGLNKLYGFFKKEFETNHNQLEQKKNIESQIKLHMETFVWKAYDATDEQKVKTDFLTASKQKQEITDKENDLDTLRIKLETDRELLENNRTQLETVRTRNLQFISKKDTLIKQMKHFQLEDYNDKDIFLIQTEHKELIHRIKTIETSYKSVNEELKVVNDTLNKISIQCSEKEKHLKQLQTEFLQTETKIKERMKINHYNKTEEIIDILNQNLNSNEEYEKINLYKNERLSKQTEKASLEKQLNGKTYDSDVHQQLKIQLEHISELVGALTKEKIGLEGKIAQLKSNLEKQSKLLDDLKQLELRATNLATLKSMFMGKKFVDYISTQYLQNLTSVANERFSKLTRQQLKLEVNESNDFIVRDLLNEGKTRSIKTLSGGQTFQAALSLALTLADQVNKRAGLNQNFFFMDEGFGSLDRESLRVVFDSLKSLHKENRVVGVISHVEDMQQDMDVYLRIIKDDKLGSIINRSWG